MAKLQIIVILTAMMAFGKEAKNPDTAYYRQWEVRTAPIAFLASWGTFDLSYRWNEKLALGPAAIIYNSNATQGSMFMPTYKGTAFGVQAYYYFRSVARNTWYLGSHLYKDSFRSYPHAFQGYEDREGFKGNATLGYQFKTDRFNWMFGIGGEQRNYDVTSYEENKSAVENSESFFGLLLEFKAGFEF